MSLIGPIKNATSESPWMLSLVSYLLVWSSLFLCQTELHVWLLRYRATDSRIPSLFLTQVRLFCSLSLLWFNFRPLEFCPLLSQYLLSLEEPHSYLTMWWMWCQPRWWTARWTENCVWLNLFYKAAPEAQVQMYVRTFKIPILKRNKQTLLAFAVCCFEVCFIECFIYCTFGVWWRRF